MELWIAAGVPSAIVAFCFWMLERRIQDRAEVEKSDRARREKDQDITEELDQKHDLENFLTRQGVNHITGE